MSEDLEHKELDGIAIIGMSGRFPGAENVNEFWENIKLGKECVMNATEEELLKQAVPKGILEHPNYVKRYASITDIDKFDSEFFHISPKEADLTDPQHRLFLEHSWKTFEDAGYNPDELNGKVGVFGGMSASSYLLHHLKQNPSFIDNAGGIQGIMHGFDKDHLATKVSYKLNLTGPSITVQTACSSSGVATILACQSLLSYQCDMAIAGGITVNVPDKVGYMYQNGSVFSKDGSCRPFDKYASGTIFGSGVGTVLLKRLDEAVDDGDHIYAVIKGFSMNNDGSDKVGYTAPGTQGQSEVIAEALEFADINPETIGYVEAHGTGTVMGDPIEVAALTQTYRSYTEKKQYCALGSVKANIGHLNAASGITSLIKSALILKNKQIPPSININEVNPELNIESSPFYINKNLKNWPKTGEIPRRVGISSFGIGGTNCHLIIEEAPESVSNKVEKDAYVFVLSARDKVDLNQARQKLIHYLEHSREDLGSISKTLLFGRKHFEFRTAVVSRDKSSAVALLKENNSYLRAHTEKKPIVFLFPGQGTQYTNMTKELYRNVKVYKEELDKCRNIILSLTNTDIYKILFSGNDKELHETWNTQPILFSVEYALTRTFMTLGIKPDVLIGHSLGEYVAACISGVLSLEHALSIVVKRGLLLKKVEKGSMVAVFSSEETLQNIISDKTDVDIAAKNSPNMFVIAGADQKVEELIHQLEKQEITYQKLHTSHAFHSKEMESIIEDFSQIVDEVAINKANIPIISNLNGEYMTEFNSTYWVKHMREPVEFAKGVSNLHASYTNTICIELGPGKVLTNLIKQNINATLEDWSFIQSLNRLNNKGDYENFLASLGQLWEMGIEIKWEMLYEGERLQRVSLPTYPFKRKTHWIGEYELESLSTIAVAYEHESEHAEKKRLNSMHDRPQLKTDYIKPETDLQANLVKLWEELLGIKSIGIKDNFFELGGHSLMATQLLSRIQENYPIQLTLEQMFSTPTVSELASFIEAELVRLLETMTEDEAKNLL